MPDSPLITVDDLLARLGDPALRIADVRWWLADPGQGTPRLRGRAPARRDLRRRRPRPRRPDGPGRHPLPDPAAFAQRLAGLGFDDTSDIVAYDDAGGTIAARLWWMLDDLGHPRVRVLDGGIGAWLAAGGPVTDAIPTFAGGTLTLRRAWSRTIDRAALVPRLGDVAVLDARAPERYRGEVEPIDPVAGHIPTARSFPTGGSLGADGRFMDAAALRDRFAPLAASGRDDVRRRGSPPATPRSRCASQAFPIPCSTRARTATGRGPGCRSRRATSPVSRRRTVPAASG